MPAVSKPVSSLLRVHRPMLQAANSLYNHPAQYQPPIICHLREQDQKKRKQKSRVQQGSKLRQHNSGRRKGTHICCLQSSVPASQSFRHGQKPLWALGRGRGTKPTLGYLQRDLAGQHLKTPFSSGTSVKTKTRKAIPANGNISCNTADGINAALREGRGNFIWAQAAVIRWGWSLGQTRQR